MEKTSEKKLKQMEETRNLPFEIGEKVSYDTQGSSYSWYEVIEVLDNELLIQDSSRPHTTPFKIKKDNVNRRLKEFYAGANPFEEKFRSIRTVNYSLDSIIFNLNLSNEKRKEKYNIEGVQIEELNWNPFVYDEKGNKQYYQRDLVWSLEQNQLLIESIYKGISCGTILIRQRSWSYLRKAQANGETEIAFMDIVDGKQRLNAIRGFIHNEFPDMHGNYYNDLSNYAQHKFGDNQLFQYADMPESTTDEETLFQFLKLNHEGVPQSKEHLDFIANLLKTVK